MANLLSSLRTSADSLGVYEKALEVTQNNVANASTPGYARQQFAPVAQRFEPDRGLSGGVGAGPIQSARSQFAERNVRRQSEGLGHASAGAELLAGVEAAFPVSADSGIAGALGRLLQSFSSWSVTPNDANARAAVLESARGLAQSFQDTATQLADASRLAEAELSGTVGQINALAGQLRDSNAEIRRGGAHDAGLEARVYSTLEQLSELVDVTVRPEADGSVTVLAGGSVPLVIGDRQYPLQLRFAQPAGPAYPDGPAAAQILDAGGAGVTGQIAGGRLAGALEVRNQVIAGLAGDSSQPGSLNRLALAVADGINGILAQGLTADGTPPADNLFVYDTGNGTAAARTLAVNPACGPGALAAVAPGPPYVSNGTALRLAGLGNPEDATTDGIGGASYLQFYSGLASQVGRLSAGAGLDKQMQAEFAAQARSLRSDIQAVSLDAEAISLVEYQRAYQAAAQMISVLSDLTEVTVNLLR